MSKIISTPLVSRPGSPWVRGPLPMPGDADLTEVTLMVPGSILTTGTSSGAMVNWSKALQKQEKWLGVEFSVRTLTYCAQVLGLLSSTKN